MRSIEQIEGERKRFEAVQEAERKAREARIADAKSDDDTNGELVGAVAELYTALCAISRAKLHFGKLPGVWPESALCEQIKNRLSREYELIQQAGKA